MFLKIIQTWTFCAGGQLFTCTISHRETAGWSGKEERWLAFGVEKRELHKKVKHYFHHVPKHFFTPVNAWSWKIHRCSSTMKTGSFQLSPPNFHLLNKVPAYWLQGETYFVNKPSTVQIFPNSKFVLAITFEPVVRLIPNFECVKICTVGGLFVK